MKNKVSCIIPAYNEGLRIAKVLKVLVKNKLIDEIIAVNDGSSDNTEEEIKKFKKVKLINYNKNMGKSYAIMRGIRKSRGNILVFIDSDLIGLNEKNINDLIKPVLKDNADVSISLRKNAPWIYRAIGLDFISGERAIKRKLLKDYSKLEGMPGFAIESVFINPRIINNHSRIKVVRWDNVESPWPADKFGFFEGNKRFIKMILLIIRHAGLFGSVNQIIKMRSLRV